MLVAVIVAESLALAEVITRVTVGEIAAVMAIAGVAFVALITVVVLSSR